MRTFLLLLTAIIITSPSAQAGFFEKLGKDLSMLSCRNPVKKAAIESVLLNKDPSKPQVWTFKFRKGKIVNNPDPRKWYTIYDKKSLSYFCWEARLSRFVSNHRLSMSPAVVTNYVCGHKVYTCHVNNEGGDNDDSQNSGFPNPDVGGDSDDGGDGDDGGDSDDGGDGDDGPTAPDNF